MLGYCMLKSRNCDETRDPVQRNMHTPWSSINVSRYHGYCETYEDYLLIVVAIPLLSRYHYYCKHVKFSYDPIVPKIPNLFWWRSNGEISWLELEPMHVVAKLTIFGGLSLQEELFLSLLFFFCEAPFGRNMVEQTDRRTLAIDVYWLYYLAGCEAL
jgi:hypothetical protein